MSIYRDPLVPTFSWQQFCLHPPPHLSTLCDQALHVSLFPPLPTPAPSDQWEDFRDFSPRFPNDFHAKARFQHGRGASHWVAPDTVCKLLLKNSWDLMYFFQFQNQFSFKATTWPAPLPMSVVGQREVSVSKPAFRPLLHILYIALLRFVPVHIISSPIALRTYI